MRDDPWADVDAVRLDEAFVAAAPVHEASADERIAAARLAGSGAASLAPWQRRALVRRAVLVGLVIAVLVVAAFSDTWWGRPDPVARALASYASLPPLATTGTSPSGSGVVPAAAGRSTAFRALQPDGASPLTWDGCRPVHYVVEPAGAPAGSARDLRGGVTAAVARVSAATGLRFVADGASTARGARWAPVRIGWSGPRTDPRLAGPALGDGAPVRAGAGGQARYVSGAIRVDAAGLAALTAPGAGRRALLRAVLQRELAHVLGLGDVTARGELMRGTAPGDVRDFGPGDLAGLAALGRGPCAAPGVIAGQPG